MTLPPAVSALILSDFIMIFSLWLSYFFISNQRKLMLSLFFMKMSVFIIIVSNFIITQQFNCLLTIMFDKMIK